MKKKKKTFLRFLAFGTEETVVTYINCEMCCVCVTGWETVYHC